MTSFKDITGFKNLRLRSLRRLQALVAVILLMLASSPVSAGSCLAPSRPFVPSDSQSTREYEGIIRADFETYIRAIQSHFRCLDEERARAFAEAREVSQDYGRFLQVIGD